MRYRVAAAITVVFIFQIFLLALFWGSAAQRSQRANQPAPTLNPYYSPPQATQTAIPTLFPAALAAPTRMVSQAGYGTGECEIAALDLIAAWVKAGKPEQPGFDFLDRNGLACQGTFSSDILPLFIQPNVWYSGATACASCHNADIKTAQVNLSLIDYANILAGSHRAESTSPGQDILGNSGPFEKSKLYFMITTHLMPVGRPPNSPDMGPNIHVGNSK
jgi:hypothetical protein